LNPIGASSAGSALSYIGVGRFLQRPRGDRFNMTGYASPACERVSPMRYAALAVDFDGTIAHDGTVPTEVLEALEHVKASGRRVILVTGRELDELLSIFPPIGLFDLVVAENGALLYRPASGEVERIAPDPSAALAEALRARGVPVSVGRSIIATVVPHEQAVLEAIRDLGLEQNVIFNKGAVMILPSGVSKASGLARALLELGLSPRNVVAMGDGENDHAMLDYVEYGAAVANAIPTLRERSHRVTKATHGAGVMEVIFDLVATDLAGATRRPLRSVALGTDAKGHEVSVAGCGTSILVTGAAATARAGAAIPVIERIHALGYQCCVLDTSGAYVHLKDAIVLGTSKAAPEPAAVLAALEKPDVSVVSCLSALAPRGREGFLEALAEGLGALRQSHCRPHWLVLDDARDLLPAAQPLPEALRSLGVLLVTEDPGDLGNTVESVDAHVDAGRGTASVYRSGRDAGRASTPARP